MIVKGLDVYRKRADNVAAVQVGLDNYFEVALWCGGEVKITAPMEFEIRVQGTRSDFTAKRGDFIVRCDDADIDAIASARRDRGDELSPSLRVARVWSITLPEEVCERYVMSQQTSYELLTR